ncbi:unnamed protein product, partial [Iphiclides podalirius]
MQAMRGAHTCRRHAKVAPELSRRYGLYLLGPSTAQHSHNTTWPLARARVQHGRASARGSYRPCAGPRRPATDARPVRAQRPAGATPPPRSPRPPNTPPAHRARPRANSRNFGKITLAASLEAAADGRMPVTPIEFV